MYREKSKIAYDACCIGNDGIKREMYGGKFSYTSQNCSSCGEMVKKSLSTRTHVCSCGCVLDRDHNAAINILERAWGTLGHSGTWVIDPFAERDL